MNANSSNKYYIWKILAALFLLLCLTSVSEATNTSASKLTSKSAVTSTIDIARQHMLDIAYLYAHHRWTASSTNVIHPNNYNYDACGGTLCEHDNTTPKQIWSYFTNQWVPIQANEMFPLVDTPNWFASGNYLFSLDLATMTDLNNGGQLTALIRDAFQTNGNIILSTAARIEVERTGGMEAGRIPGKWVIDDAGTRYQIRQQASLLYVYDGGENEGVPYSWGMSSSLIATQHDLEIPISVLNPPMRDVFLPISRGYQTLPFDELIDNKFFAGNQNHDTDNGNRQAAGVDCIGLINNAWQMGARVPMIPVRDEYAPPIQFKDLKPGDILMDETIHVMLFGGFENYDPAGGGEPIEGVTRFWVYESAIGPGKVVRHDSYVLSTMNPITPDDPADGPVYVSNPGVSFMGARQFTDIITIVGLDDDNRNPYHFIPRTYYPINSIDVVLVIDKSVSMLGDKINNVKDAAKTFVDLMRPGDRLGVVAFDGSAIPVYPPLLSGLQSMDSRAEQINAEAIINQILVDGGGTSIGAGLHKAVADLSYGTDDGTPTGTPDPFRVIILFSDGGENASPLYASISPEITNANIIVYTVSIGGDITGHNLMKRIASEHGGDYQWVNPPKKIYSALNSIRDKIYGNNTVVQATPSQAIAAGEAVVENMLVDSAMGSMTLSFFKPASDFILTLTQPDGNPLDINAPNVTYASGANYETYTILAPQTGTWTTSVSSASGGEYSLSTSTMDAMTLSVSADKNAYISGDPIKITASVNDSTSGSLMAAPAYIHGATMQVTVENPTLTQFAFDLYDDGLHNDGAADDGIYANAFAETGRGGSYNFNVHVSGNNNRDGSPFTREYPLTAVVTATSPTVVSGVRANANPSNLNSVDFTVKFSKPVTGVDITDFTLTKSVGVTGEAVSAVNASGAITALSIAGNDFPQTDVTATALTGLSDTYTVTVNTGAGNGTLRLNVINDGSITDAVLKPLSGATFLGETYAIDKIAPTVKSSVVAGATSTSVNFTVTFSENVTGVDANDFIATNATASSVSGAGKVYTVTVNTGSGTIRLDVADDDTIIDVASNPLNGGFTAGATYQIATPPNVPAFDATSFANNALVVDYTPAFNWATVVSQLPTGIVFDHYQLQVSADSLFNTTATDANIVGRANSIYTLPVDLTPNTKFYWRLRSVNAHGDFSAWSPARYFRAAMLPPALLLPANGAIFDNKRPTFTWDSVTGATSYTIQFSTSSGFGVIARTVLNVATPHTLTADLAGGVAYYWRVRANGANGPSLWSAPAPKFTAGNPPSIPALSSPANNALITDYTPLLDWANSTLPAGTAFDHYQIQVATDFSFASIVLDDTTATGGITASSSAPSADLASNKKYYWRVRSYNIVGAGQHYSSWSVARSFRAAILPPVLVSPENSVALDNKRPTFTWNSVAGAATYTLEVAAADTFAVKVVNFTTAATSYIPTVDLLANKHYWRVKANAAVGNNGPSGYSTIFAFTAGSPPSIPVLSSPANGALVPPNVAQLFNWLDSTVPAGVTFNRYEIQIAHDLAFMNLFQTADNLTGISNSQFASAPLVTGTTYYWRVRSVGNFKTTPQYSSWSAPRAVKAKFTAPVLLTPANTLAPLGDLTPTFTWDPIHGASNYTLQVASNATFTVGLISQTVPASSSPSYTLTPPLTPDQTYYWHVRVDGVYAPVFSATWKFFATYPIPSVLSSARASANPANAANVNFTVTFSEPVAGVDVSDFVLTTTGVSGATVSGVSGSGAIYAVTVNTGSGDGVIRLDVLDNDTIVNSVPKPLNGGYTSGESYTIDKTAPITAIISKPNSLDNNATPTFTFSGDNGAGNGGASLMCKMDNDSYAACASPFTSPVLADGLHTFYVYAVDKAGNQDASPESYAWTVDATAPETQIDSAPSSFFNSASATFAFSSADSDIASFECLLDGVAYASCVSPMNYANLAEGSHTFNVSAKDLAGNVDATPAAHIWIVDATAPTVAIISKPNSLDNNATPTFTFSGDDGAGSGVASLMCKMDNDSYAACASPFTSPVLADGLHAFYVYAVDKAGNQNASPESYAWTVDTTPPTVISISRLNANPTSVAAIVRFRAIFSESVTGVDVADFVLKTIAVTGVIGESITNVSGTGAIYTITVNTGSGSGTIRLDAINDNTIIDAALNPLAGDFTNGDAYAVRFLAVSSAAANDGWVLESSEFSNGGNMMNAVSALRVGDDSANKQYRSLLYFNTSSLPDNATITHATVKIKKAGMIGTDPFTTHGALTSDMAKGFFGLSPLETTDFEAPGALIPSAGSFAAVVGEPNWYQLNLNSAYCFQYVNLFGATQFRLRFALDDNNDLNMDSIAFYSGDEVNVDWRPVFIISYTTP